MRQGDINSLLPRKINSIQFFKKDVKIGKKLFFSFSVKSCKIRTRTENIAPSIQKV